MITKKIMILASYDWSMRQAMKMFVDFLDPVIKYKGKEYKIELGRIIAKPFLCGQNLKEEGDVVVDRTVHWNLFYRFWAQQAMNCGVTLINNSNTFPNYDKHTTYDLMARAIHPADHFPITVLIPPYMPYTEDLERDEMWRDYQSLIIENTAFGWDESRKKTDWEKVNSTYKRYQRFADLGKEIRKQFYYPGNYLKETVDNIFHGKFPLFLKKAKGGGGADVYKVNNLEELYRKYDEASAGGGKVFHLQEGVLDYELFIRCMAIGPQVLPIRFLADLPLHQHYAPDKLKVNKDIFERLYNYVLLINSYHRWTYNSFECIIKNGQINPIDFANACPDSHFTSLHVHFPWVICALVKWLSFCAVTEKDLKIDMEQERYLKVLNDPNKTGIEKYEFYSKLNKEYFETDRFNEFCEENFKDIKQKMIDFYDKYFDKIVETAIMMSDFPDYEHEKFYHEYKERMDTVFRPNAELYLTDVVYENPT